MDQDKRKDIPEEVSRKEKRKLKTIMARCLREAYRTHERLGERGLEEVRTNQFGEMALRIDIECEKAVIAVLRQSGRKMRVVSEEHGTFDIGMNPDYLVVLDGLDGTGVYKKRNGGRYGTMCTIFKGTNPRYTDYIAGGIMEHSYGNLYLYVKGEGATVRNLETGVVFPPIHTLEEKYLIRKMFIYVDEYFLINKETFSDRLQGFWTMYLGSTAADFAYLAIGIAAAMGQCTRRPLKDNLELAVGYGLIREAGGVVYDLEGNDIGDKRYFAFGNKEHIPVLAAANHELAIDILEHIKNK
jgi:fructose-1,6-bisphosphatase/inositol monophosphatase family enzyme